MELGSPLYMAPELFADDDDDTEETRHHHLGIGVDVYAFSILMYEIITEKVPFAKNGNSPRLLSLIKQVSRGVRPEFTSSVTEKMKDLLTRCWSAEPCQRPPFSEIFNLLSNDFSYISEEVNEEEIKEYIDKLKKSRKEAEPSPNKTNFPNDQISIQKVSYSKFYIEPYKVKLVEHLFDHYYYNFYTATVSQDDGDDIFCLAKILNDNVLDGNYGELRFMLNEIDKQSIFDHPAILPLQGVTFPIKEGEKYASYSRINTRRTLKDVFDLASKKSAPDNYETIKAISIFGIAAGMAYMHQKNIAHCDLKIENVFLDEDDHPKIYGFYFTSFDGEIRSDAGTPIYMAPELFQGDSKSLTKKVDVYSYSLVLYMLLTGNIPFVDQNVKNYYKLVDLVMNGERPTIENCCISSVQEELIHRCWDHDPSKRPSAIQIVKELIDKKEQFFDFSLVDESKYDEYVKKAIQGLELSLV